MAPSAAVLMSFIRKATDTDIRVDYELVREIERDMPKESKEEWLQREKIREECRKKKGGKEVGCHALTRKSTRGNRHVSLNGSQFFESQPKTARYPNIIARLKNGNPHLT